jgi:hypothetical protein
MSCHALSLNYISVCLFRASCTGEAVNGSTAVHALNGSPPMSCYHAGRQLRTSFRAGAGWVNKGMRRVSGGSFFRHPARHGWYDWKHDNASPRYSVLDSSCLIHVRYSAPGQGGRTSCVTEWRRPRGPHNTCAVQKHIGRSAATLCVGGRFRKPRERKHTQPRDSVPALAEVLQKMSHRHGRPNCLCM